MKIPNKSLVKIHGWVMLKKVKENKTYLIIHDDTHAIYWFCTPSTKRAKVGHFASDVDCWVNNLKNYNRIEILDNGAAKF